MPNPELKVKVIASLNSLNVILEAIQCLFINIKTKSSFSKVFLFWLTKTIPNPKRTISHY